MTTQNGPGECWTHPRGPQPTKEATVNDSTAPAPHLATEECFACDRGVVYIGYLVEDEDGATQEVFEPISCRRCAGR